LSVAALDVGEIEPGLVVFLDQEALAADGLVTHTSDLPSFSARTFVCFLVDGEISEWVPTTTEYRPERLQIRRAWRSGGHPQWLSDQQYLTDGANVWRGPHEAFAEASRLEVTSKSDRARIAENGLTAIRKEVEAQRYRRVRT
jgi:hypothetical protein